MGESILNGKKILVVDDEPDVLEVLVEEILVAAPKCTVEKSTSYQEAAKKFQSQTFDLAILDIMGVRGFDLLNLAVQQNLPVVMLTAHALTPEALKQSFEMKARAYLPKEKLGEIVPFLEDILEESDSLSGWARQMKKLESYFQSRWGESWQKLDERFWRDFEHKTSHMKR